MIQVRFFELKDWEKCNEFMKTTRPRGEKGFISNNAGFVVVYEDGKPMDKYDRLNKLRFQLGEHQEKIYSYEKELLISEAMTKEYLSRPDLKEYDKKRFQEANETELKAKAKMIVLEKLSMGVTEKLIKEVSKEK